MDNVQQRKQKAFNRWVSFHWIIHYNQKWIKISLNGAFKIYESILTKSFVRTKIMIRYHKTNTAVLAKRVRPRAGRI